MEISVTDFLQREDCNRVFQERSKDGLFECLSSHAFSVNCKDFQKEFKTFMLMDDQKNLFRSILQLSDKTGTVPAQKHGEVDKAFKTRLAELYNEIVWNCGNILPKNSFMHLHLFAVATWVGIPIYILQTGVTGELAWYYYPCLYRHDIQNIRENIGINEQEYITMYFSENHCYMIDSSKSKGVHPKSYGMIGEYQKLLRHDSHLSEFTQMFCELEETIIRLAGNASSFVQKCQELAEEIQMRRCTVNKAVIGSSSVGAVGGILMITGLALTPVTFGASLGLTIAGGVIGTAGGITSGLARAVEGLKQNKGVDEIIKMKDSLVDQEKQLMKLIFEIENGINQYKKRYSSQNFERPGINLKGFFAIGSALKSLHGPAAIGVAALKVGATGSFAAASVLGPVSLLLDIGFLLDAAINLRRGSKTGVGNILEKNVKAIEMKMMYFICLLRGNRETAERIVELS